MNKKPDEIFCCPECGKIINKKVVICPQCKSIIWRKFKVKDFGTVVEGEDKILHCPICGSVQLLPGTNKGYDFWRGLVWGLLLFPLGFIFGLIGCNKATITCLRCGYKWYAGSSKGM